MIHRVSLFYEICKEIAILGHSMNRLRYRKGTSIRQAPVFQHLRALRKSQWKIIIWMNEL